MRIAIDARSLMEGRHSGVEEYTTQIIRGLARVAPRHTYHLFYNAVRAVSLPTFPANVRVHGFSYPSKVMHASQFAFSIPKWDKLVPADVYFVPNPRLMPLSPESPLVSVVHDLSFERFPEFLDGRRRMWHRLMRPRVLLENSDHIIAVSEHTKRDVMRLYGISDGRISVVHSGVSHQTGQARAAQLQRVRQTYSLPERFILSFGQQEPRKNIASVVRAFAAIAGQIPHDLVIAGEEGWKRYAAQAAARESGAVDRVYEIGFVREEDKAALYAAADLLVYPSFYEGFGFPVLEALGAGTPVVTSFNSSLPEVVGEWATLVDPYNVSQLATVMREMLSESRRIPIEVRQAIWHQYDWDTAARQTADILERVA